MPLGAIPQEVVAPYRFVNCIPLMVFAKSRTIGADMQFLSRLPLAAKVAALAALVISVVALGAGFYAVTQINARMAEIVEGQVRDRSIHMSRAAELALPGGKVEAQPFTSAIADFYMTNPIARASATLAECSAIAKGAHQQAAE